MSFDDMDCICSEQQQYGIRYDGDGNAANGHHLKGRKGFKQNIYGLVCAVLTHGISGGFFFVFSIFCSISLSFDARKCNEFFSPFFREKKRTKNMRFTIRTKEWTAAPLNKRKIKSTSLQIIASCVIRTFVWIVKWNDIGYYVSVGRKRWYDGIRRS